MTKRKLNTTKEISDKASKKIQEWMGRIKKTGKKFNPAPRASKPQKGG